VTFGWTTFDSGSHGAAFLMAHYHDQRNMQVLGPIFKTSQFRICGYVAGHADDKQVSQSLIEDDLRRHTRIGTTEDFSVWVLAG
jgi:hypothetical protein